MMKRTIVFVFALLCGIAYGQEIQRQRLEQHLYTLASDSLRGREAGTDDGRRAASYIINQWEQMGLQPMFADDFSMPFAHVAGNFNNLVAVIHGNDPELKDEFIVIGAHYDHVGIKDGKIFNGADDNASGSSCMLEVARQLQAQKDQLHRSVIICAFDAEEKGLYGSSEFVGQLKKRGLLDKVKLMLSVDMVGWYKANGELILEGTGTLKDSKDILDPEKLGVDIKVRYKVFENSLFTATDTEPFATEGIPTLAVTTGLKSPYHKPEDDADLIDYEGLDLVTNYVVGLTLEASRRDGRIASGRVAPKHSFRTFEVGLTGGFNSCHLQFPDATFTGKSFFGLLGGLTMQYNFSKSVTLRTAAIYNYSHSPLPSPNDAYGSGFSIEQQTLLVPVILQVDIQEMGMGVYFGFGLYYGHEIDGGFYGDVPTSITPYSLSHNPQQVGLVFNLGMRLGGHWLLEGTWYNQLSNMFDPASGMPNTKNRLYSVSLGYLF